MTKTPTITVVIVSFNSSDMLAGLLDSLEEGMRGVDSFDVIMVDNNSRDTSVEIARAHPQKPRIIEMGINAGYAAAINAATAVMDPDSHLLLLNPDLRMYEGTGRVMLDRLADSTIGAVMPRNFSESGKTHLTIRREPTVLTAWAESLLGGKRAARHGLGEMINTPQRYETTADVEWATGSAMLIPAKVRAAVGPWDETFFLYSEEVDYQRRIREAGLRIVYEPQAKVMHRGGEHGTNPRLYGLLTANRVRYFARHHGPLSTFLFRLGLGTGSLIRLPSGAVHRAGLQSIINPEKTVADFLANRQP